MNWLGRGDDPFEFWGHLFDVLRRLRHGESSGWYDAGLARHVAPDGVAPTDAPLEHRSGRLAHASDVMPIGLVHDVRNGRDVGSCRSSDAKFLHNQSLRTALMNESADLAMCW